MNIIRKLSDVPEHARLCLYGAGEVGMSLFLLLKERRPDVRVVCFVDSFKNGERHGVAIVSPETLQSRAADFDQVVITSLVFADQIRDILEKHGIDRYSGISPVLEDVAPTAGPKILYAFYDRAVSPDGFDIVLFLYLAELERLKRGYDAIHVVIVPKQDASFVRHGEALVYGSGHAGQTRDAAASTWYERNVLIPCCWLMPSCGKVSLLGSREEAGTLFGNVGGRIFPEGYAHTAPRENYAWSRIVRAVDEAKTLPSFRATPAACEHLKPWLERQAGGKPVVSITFRESLYQQDRNGNADAWIRFARTISADGFFPVFIRDTGVALEEPAAELAEFCIFREGSWNLELRMALYELAYLNMFTGGGPSILAHYNRTVPLVRFQVMREGVFECSRQHLEADGLTYGRPLPGATPFQITVWGEERYERMVREFHALHEKMPAARAGESAIPAVGNRKAWP